MLSIKIYDKLEIVNDKMVAINNYNNDLQFDLNNGLVQPDQIEFVLKEIKNNNKGIEALNQVLTNILEML